MVPVIAAYSVESVGRSLVAEEVVAPRSAVAGVAAIDPAADPIVAAEAAATVVVAVRTALAAGIGRLNTVTASTVVADYSPAADSLAVVVALDSLAGAATVLPDVGPEALLPWLCPSQEACQKKTWLDADAVECEMTGMT